MNRTTKITLIISSIIIILVIILSFTISKPQTSIPIKNLSQKLRNLPNSHKTYLESQLLNISKLHNNNQPIKNTSGFIRSDSFKSNNLKTPNAFSGQFIVDIPKLQQSYSITYSYLTNQRPETIEVQTHGHPPILITCPPDDKNVYKDFKCKKHFTQGLTNPNDIIQHYLPYHKNTESNHPFIVLKKTYNTGDPYLEIKIDSCNNETITKEALDLTNNWLKSEFNLSLNDFKTEVLNLCNESN